MNSRLFSLRILPPAAAAITGLLLLATVVYSPPLLSAQLTLRGATSVEDEPSRAQDLRRQRKADLAAQPQPSATEASAPAEAEATPGPILNVASAYTFLTGTNGSLTDMSAGTTQLIRSGQIDNNSAVVPIGFDFFFQGTRQDRFSVNAYGVMSFGATPMAYNVYDALRTTGSYITAYSNLQRTRSGNGKVHYKVIGTAPNRTLVIEWLNIQSHFEVVGGAPPNATYQVRLTEGTGVIEFVYGTMTQSDISGSLAASSPQIGFSTGSGAGAWASLRVTQSGGTITNQTSGTPTQNSYNPGPIPALSSTADGSRRFFRYTPPTPLAPGLPTSPTQQFSSITQTGMTLNWRDLATNELAYAIYNSTDGVNFNFVTTLAANTTTYAATNLYAGTTYHWQICAVSEGGMSILTGSQATAAANVFTSTATGGLWSATGTWAGGAVPSTTGNDAVVIAAGATVTIDTNPTVYSINVAGTGTLQFSETGARTLTVSRDVTIASGGTFQSNPLGTVTTHALSLGGSLTNDGTLDFSTNGNTAGATIAFTGSIPAAFSGSGGVTDIRSLTVNKVALANRLELRPSNFSVQGSTGAAPGGWLTLTAGTLRIAGTFTGTNPVFTTAAYSIGNTTGFWLDNPNYTVSAQAGSASVAGLFRLTQGTFNHGNATAHSFTGSGTPTFQIEGGTLNSAGQFRPGNALYNQSGGIVNVATVGSSATTGSFDMSGTGTFNMTGGSIVLVRPNANASGFDYRVIYSDAQKISLQGVGGTVQAGSADTPSNSTFRLRSYLPNLRVSGAGTTALITAPSLASDIVIYGSVTIDSGTTLNLNGLTCFFCGPSFTNNGTLNGTILNPSTSLPSRLVFWDMEGSPSTYSGTGTVTPSLQSFEVDNAEGVTIDPAVNQIVALQIVMASGHLTGTNKVTLGNGGSTTATFQMGDFGGGTPSIDTRPIYNPGTGGITLIYATRFTTTSEVPADRRVTRLDIFNSGGVTLAGGDLTVTGEDSFGDVSLGFYILTTGPNTLILNSPNVVISGSGWIHGALRKPIAGTGSRTFEVGTDLEASNVDVNVTSGTFPANLTVRCTAGRPPWVHNSVTGLDRFWDITTSATISGDLIFHYFTDTFANLTFLRQVGSTFSVVAPSVAVTNSVARRNGVSSIAGGWALLNPAASSFVSANRTTFHIGRSNSFAVQGAGMPPPTFSLVAGTLPTGVNFNATTGELSGTPASGTAGPHALTFQASNGVGSPATQNFILDVNTPPIAGTDIIGTRLGQPTAVPAGRLLINDSDPDGDAIGVTAVSPTSAMGGTVGLNAGVVTYAPPPSFFGADAFTYTLTDAMGGTTSGTVNVSIVASSSNVSGLTLPGGVPTLTAYGIVGRTYQLQFASVMSGTWLPLGDPQIAGTDGSFVLIDPTPPPLPPQRFYRVIETP